MAHDVFVSYSTKDKPTADAICAALEANGIRCWIAPRDILPGSDWGEAIIDAIHGSRAMVLVFSGSSNDSPQIKREIERAVNAGIPVVPFRIEDVLPSKTLEYFISTQHWLDALTPPLEKHLQYLANTMRAMLVRKVDGSEAEVKEPQLKPQPAAPAAAAPAAPEPPPPTAAAPAPSPAAGDSGRKFPSPLLIGILILAVAVATLAGVLWRLGDGPPKPPAVEETLCNTGNIYAVQNRPTSPTTFTTTKAYKITYFFTYHWNYGKGAPGGTVALRSSEGVTYGPWQVRTTPGQGGVPNANWIATPNVVIPPGTYTVIDSDPSTWAQNSFSGGRGFAEIRGK